MRALRFTTFGPVSNLSLVELPDPRPDATTAVVRVAGAAINPSDVKNVEGKMEHVTLPRIPGRDYAGTVVGGPADWMGQEVWGTGGEIGYTIDGSHAELIAVPVASLRRKPAALSFEQAGTVGTPYLAAWLGLIEYARLDAGESLLVIGARGGVGTAVAQIGKWRGATVIGIDRGAPPTGSAESRVFDRFATADGRDSSAAIGEAVRERRADVVFDAVGGPTVEPALRALAPRGRLIEIASAGDRRIAFDLVDFYHNESRLIGADTRKRDAMESAVLLDRMRPLFDSGALAGPAIDRIVPLADGVQAYEQMAQGAAKGRIVLGPGRT
jgi:NADPH2:quinone reductase